MQVERLIKKCAICGKEDNYLELVSNYTNGLPDLDLRPRGSMASPGAEIQMCPNCGYCNYDIEEHVQSRFKNVKNPLELWQQYEQVQNILKQDINTTYKKYLIMAEQYRGNLEHEKSYNMTIKASWAAESKEHDIEIKKVAISVFLDEILPKIRSQLFQFADISRQCGYFEPAEEIVKAGELLIDVDYEDAKLLTRLAEYEKELITKKDTDTHNLTEMKK